MDDLKKILILTPDAIGSTFFQRTLTIYLNSVGVTAVNFHELTNHILTKSDSYLYQALLNSNKSVVARASHYRTTVLSPDQHDKYLFFCKNFFNHIIFIKRCPFESILSHSMRLFNQEPSLNVYTKEAYNNITAEASYKLPEKAFLKGIRHFEQFYLWVEEHFPNHLKIDYFDLVQDTEGTLSTVFSLPRSNLNLTKYNQFTFKMVRKLDLSNYTPQELIHFIEINDYINSLVEKSLMTTNIPLKKTTLQEKQQTLTNFFDLLRVYNDYPSNLLKKVSESEVEERVQKESDFWIT